MADRAVFLSEFRKPPPEHFRPSHPARFCEECGAVGIDPESEWVTLGHGSDWTNRPFRGHDPACRHGAQFEDPSAMTRIRWTIAADSDEVVVGCRCAVCRVAGCVRYGPQQWRMMWPQFVTTADSRNTIRADIRVSLSAAGCMHTDLPLAWGRH